MLCLVDKNDKHEIKIKFDRRKVIFLLYMLNISHQNSNISIEFNLLIWRDFAIVSTRTCFFICHHHLTEKG